MKTPFMLAGLVLLASLTPACSGTEGAADSGQTDLELLTWWSQKSELDAIQAVIDVNDAKHPDVHVRVLKSDTQQTMVSDVQSRLADGTPPTAFQANLGGNALQWAESAQPLNARAKSWSRRLHGSIAEPGHVSVGRWSRRRDSNRTVDPGSLKFFLRE